MKQIEVINIINEQINLSPLVCEYGICEGDVVGLDRNGKIVEFVGNIYENPELLEEV